MKRKAFSNVVVRVGARAYALIALSLAIPMAVALSSCDRDEPNCPKRTMENEESNGLEVLIDYEDVATGVTTRSVTDGRSLGRRGEGFDVEADGLRRYDLDYDKYRNPLPINPVLTFYAKENVLFEGWSWRYATDALGTHRDSKGNIIADYIATQAFQYHNGTQELNIGADKTSFTAQYRPGTMNKVFVKVKYRKVDGGFRSFPSRPNLYGISCMDVPGPSVESQSEGAYSHSMWKYNKGSEELYKGNYLAARELMYEAWKDYLSFLESMREQIYSRWQSSIDPNAPEYESGTPEEDMGPSPAEFEQQYEMMGSEIENWKYYEDTFKIF